MAFRVFNKDRKCILVDTPEEVYTILGKHGQDIVGLPTRKECDLISELKNNSVIQDVSDLPEFTKKEIKEFFETYKRLEPNKWVKVKDFKSREEAENLVEEGRKRAE